MRLTLRTLLAYMDKVLSPEDHKALKEQIEASDLASELLHQTGDVVRRPQLGAPEVLGLGPVDDPNTMSEYLDGTLSEEGIVEFERSCLDSEVILAEAVATHHVLAMVLGSAAEVDPDTRARMHALQKELLAQQHEGTPQEDQGEIVGESGLPPEEGSPHVPSYLLEAKRSALWRWAPAVASLLLLAVTAFLLFAPATEEPVAQAPSRTVEASVRLEEDRQEADTTADPGTGEKVVSGEASEPEFPIPREEAAQTETPPAANTTAEPTLEEAGPIEPLSEEPPTASPELPSQDRSNEEQEEPAAVEEVATTPEEPGSSPGEAAPVVEATPPAAETPAPRRGLYVGPEASLLVAHSEPDTWTRRVVGSELPLGGRIVSLPTYRPEVVLNGKVRMELVDLTEVVLSEVNPDDSIEVELVHGRCRFESLDPGEPIDLVLLLNDLRCQVRMGPGAILAIEVDHQYVAGTDLLGVSPPLVSRVYSPKGNVAWEAGGGVYRSAQPKQWGLTSKGEPSEPRDYVADPGWIAGGTGGTVWDRRASPLLLGSVGTESDVWLALRDVIDSEAYKEVRLLAAHCSAVVGHPDALVGSFSDDSQQASWGQNLARLRAVASRSRVQAEGIRKAMLELYGEEVSGVLFTLLCGFGERDLGQTPEELRRGALDQLIDWLENESLAIRVLANLNLEELTGRVAAFDPTDTPKRRRQSAKKLRNRLNANDLRLTTGG